MMFSLGALARSVNALVVDTKVVLRFSLALCESNVEHLDSCQDKIT